MRYRWIVPVMAICMLGGCGGSRQALTQQQEAALKAFVAKCNEGTGVLPQAELAEVVAIGDPAVPRLVGRLFGDGKTPAPDDDIVVVALARIGTPAAVQAIENALKPGKPLLSPMGLETAADALVGLGAVDAVPALIDAIARVEQANQDRRTAQRYGETPDRLKRSLEQLQSGEGKIDMAEFPIRITP